MRNHHLEDWVQLEALRGSQFEAAVDAVVAGSEAGLERLLGENPELIRARSTRKHHSTLLHYVGANGVEDFRQKTPKNAVKIAEMLLDAGAEVNAVADMYGGGSTTLGLTATSIHPHLAGVVDGLIETLLNHGAAMDSGIVNGCLANGRRTAAESLARRGARLDLEGAAGVGRLDIVKSLHPNATSAQIKDGFTWACEFGRTDVVDFLLQAGMDVAAKLKHHGQTGLHWAAHGGHFETVKLLLERGAPVDVRDDSFGGTPLDWALHGRTEHGGDAYDRVIEALLAAGV